MTIATNVGSYKIMQDGSLVPNVCTSVDCSPGCVTSDSSPGCPPSDLESTPIEALQALVPDVTPRICSRLVMALYEATTVVHSNQRLTREFL